MKKTGWFHIVQVILIFGIAYVVNFGISLILTPYITSNIGADAYGFVSLAKQFVQVTVIVKVALNAYVARYIGVAYHEDNKERALVYFNSAFWGDFVLAIVICIVMLPVISYLEYFITIPAEIEEDVKVLFALVFCSAFLETTFSVFECAAYVKNRLDITGTFKMLSYICKAAVAFFAYCLLPAKVSYVGLAMVAATAVVSFSNLWLTKKLTPEMRIKKGTFSVATVKELVRGGVWNSLTMVGELLNNGIDLLICNQMLSSIAMGQLAIAKTMGSIMQDLCLIVDQAYTPLFLKSYARNDKTKLLQQLKQSMKVSSSLTNLMFAGFVALGIAYYRLWIPDQDISLIYNLSVITMLTSVFGGVVHPLHYIYTLTVKKKIPSIVNILGGIVNAVAMYILIRYAGKGIYVVVWTTVIVMGFINLVINPLYMAHILDVPYKTFYPEIFRGLISCAVLVFVYKGLSEFYVPTTWLSFAVCVILYALIGCLIHFGIVLDAKERSDLLPKLKRRIFLLRNRFEGSKRE